MSFCDHDAELGLVAEPFTPAPVKLPLLLVLMLNPALSLYESPSTQGKSTFTEAVL